VVTKPVFIDAAMGPWCWTFPPHQLLCYNFTTESTIYYAYLFILFILGCCSIRPCQPYSTLIKFKIYNL